MYITFDKTVLIENIPIEVTMLECQLLFDRALATQIRKSNFNIFIYRQKSSLTTNTILGFIVVIKHY